MSPACGHLSLFRGKRSVLVSLEVFRDGRQPARCLLASWFLCLLVPRAFWFPGPSGSRVRRSLGPPPLPGCALPGLATPAARPGRPVTGRPWPAWLVFPAAAPGCPGPSARARLPAGSAGRRAGPGPARMRAGGQPANMTLVSVNGSQSRPGPAAKVQTGWRCTVAYRLRSVTSPGKRAGRASRPPLISLRCSQFVTQLKHIPVAVTLPRKCL
jgi:hypothetical protein